MIVIFRVRTERPGLAADYYVKLAVFHAGRPSFSHNPDQPTTAPTRINEFRSPVARTINNKPRLYTRVTYIFIRLFIAPTKRPRRAAGYSNGFRDETRFRRRKTTIIGLSVKRVRSRKRIYRCASLDRENVVFYTRTDTIFDGQFTV